MKQKSFEKALSATARVACCSFLFTAVSCKPKNPPNDIVPPPGDDSNINISEDKNQNDTIASDFPNDFQECITEFNTVFEQLPLNLTDKSVSCCEEYISFLENSEGGSLEYRYECCDVVTDAAKSVCAPWGPPTPPKMSRLNS